MCYNKTQPVRVKIQNRFQEEKMKRNMTAAILLLLALAVPAAVGAETRYVDTAARDASLRSEPNTEAEETASIPDGTAVEVLENNGIWAKVQAGSETGWIRTRYLSDKEPEEAAETAAEQDEESLLDLDYSSFVLADPYYTHVQAGYTGGFVNLRWAPSKVAAVQHRINDGGEIVVLAEGDEWDQVMDDETGYVGFLQKQFVVPQASEAVAP